MRTARWVIALLSPLLLSGCDVLEARRLNAEAAASRAKAAEISAIYTGRVAETEAETAQILAEQQAAEEDRESRLAAEIQQSLLRQAELDRRALRRAAELPFWAMMIFVGIGLPLIVVGGLYAVFSFGRGRSGAPLYWYLIARAQRRGLLPNPPATIVALPTREQITIGSQTDDSNGDGDNIIRI